LARAQQQFAGKGVVFVGISVMDTEEDARRFVAEKGLAFANGRDPGLRIARAYRVEATPTTFLITPAGGILDRHNGALAEDQLAEAVQNLLDHKGP
jgi:peroxiredoxin